MKSTPHTHPSRPDAADKGKRESCQGWMKQEQEQRSIQASSNTVTRLPSPKTTQEGGLNIEAKQQSRKRPQGAPGTNAHSASAGISVHNALLNLGPPPPDARVRSKHLPWLRLTDQEMMSLRKRMKKNAKWRPSDEMTIRSTDIAGTVIIRIAGGDSPMVLQRLMEFGNKSASTKCNYRGIIPTRLDLETLEGLPIPPDKS